MIYIIVDWRIFMIYLGLIIIKYFFWYFLNLFNKRLIYIYTYIYILNIFILFFWYIFDKFNI